MISAWWLLPTAIISGTICFIAAAMLAVGSRQDECMECIRERKEDEKNGYKK